MTNVSNNYQPNYGNALATAAIGGTAWGLGQYFFNKKPFVDSAGNISDKFVKSMEDVLLEIKDEATSKNVEFQKGLEKEIDALKSHDELKEFINNRKKDFMRINDDEIKIITDDIAKTDVEGGKEYVKRIFKSDGKYQKFYRDILDSCYDSSGKLNCDATKISQKNWEALKDLINKARRYTALKAAGSFAAVCAVCCCLSEYIGARNK